MTIDAQARVRRVSTLEEFGRLEEEWNHLLDQSSSNVPFLRHEWLTCWWKRFIKADDVVHIVTIYDDGELVATAPLYLTRQSERGGQYCALRLMSNSHSPRCDVIIHGAHDRKKLIEKLWDEILKIRGWDFLLLCPVPDYKDESVTLEVIKSSARKTGHVFSLQSSYESPTLALGGRYSDWDEYFKSRKGKFRRNLNRRARKLAKEVGEVRVELVDAYSESFHEVLDKGLAIEASGWKGRSKSAILFHEEVRQFYHDLSKAALECGWLRLYYLYAGPNLVAFAYCLVYGGAFYLLKIGYDEEFGWASPGQLLRKHEIEDSIHDELAEYDFLGPKMDWKMDWTDEVRPHFAIFIYGKGLKGSLLKTINAKVIPLLRKSKLLRKLSGLDR